jgi:hypothetical protein
MQALTSILAHLEKSRAQLFAVADAFPPFYWLTTPRWEACYHETRHTRQIREIVELLPS